MRSSHGRKIIDGDDLLALYATIAALIGPIVWLYVYLVFRWEMGLPSEQRPDGPQDFGLLMLGPIGQGVGLVSSLILLAAGGWRAESKRFAAASVANIFSVTLCFFAFLPIANHK